jgi:hypoxanthine phosphoribosyltransferase
MEQPLSIPRPRRTSPLTKNLDERLRPVTKRAKKNDDAPPERDHSALFRRVTPELVPYVREIMYTEGEIRTRAAELGAQITEHYRAVLAPGEPLIVVGLLKGALPFMNELVTHLALPTILEYISVHSYAGTETSGSIDFRHDMETDPAGQHCLIVDDIVDTGGTLEWAVAHLRGKGAASVKSALMLDKKERRTQPIEGDFVGFQIPNKFVVGFGLDFDQKMRNLPFVAVLAPAYHKKSPYPVGD